MSRYTLLAAVGVAAVGVAAVLAGAGAYGAAGDANLPAGVEARFVGVRYDAGNAIYTPDGKRIVEGEYIPCLPITWDKLQMRRDFVFEFKPGDNKVIIARDALVAGANDQFVAVSPVGMTVEERGGGWFRVSLVTLLQRETRVYTRSQTYKTYVPEAMDVAIRFYCKDRGARRFEFRGPFADRTTVVSADGGCEATFVTGLPGRGEERASCWVVPCSGQGRSEDEALVVARDKNGKTYVLAPSEVSCKSGGGFGLKGCSLDDIVSMTVNLPYEFRAAGVNVKDRDGRIVDHAPYLDALPERLGRQSDKPQDLAWKRLDKVSDLANLTDIPPAWILNIATQVGYGEEFHDANALKQMRASARLMLLSQWPLMRAAGGRMAVVARDESQMDGILGVVTRGYVGRTSEPLPPHLFALEPGYDGLYQMPLYEAGAGILSEFCDWRGLSADSAVKVAKLLPAVREPFRRKWVLEAITASQDNGYKACRELLLGDDTELWRWAARTMISKSPQRLKEWTDMPEKAKERLVEVGWRN